MVKLLIKNGKIFEGKKNIYDKKLYSRAIDEITNNELFIKKLIELTNSNNDVKNFEKILYYSFVYFLENFNDLNFKIQPYLAWYTTNNLIQKLKIDSVNLDYSIGNLKYIEDFLHSKNIKVISNERNFLNFLLCNIYDNFLIFYFLFRKFFRTFSFSKLNFKVLCISNYDRYYKNKNYFSNFFLNSVDFKKLVKSFGFQKSMVKVVYPKFSFSNFWPFLKNLLFEKKFLFFEDFLSFKIYFKLLFFSAKLDNSIKSKNDVQEYILKSYKHFIKNEFKFFLWSYLSIKKKFPDKEMLIIGDVETNLLFYIFNMYQKIEKRTRIKTISYSHDTISSYRNKLLGKNYLFPDLKFVWNKKSKDYLVKNYSIDENKIQIQKDPRFLYWEQFKLQKKSILIVSPRDPKFYNELNSNKLKEVIKNLIENGHKIYFKPHPLEHSDSNSLKLINSLKKNRAILIIDNLNFIPQHTIGNISVMLYELYSVGSEVFSLSKENLFNFDEKYFSNHICLNFSDFFEKVVKKSK